MTSQASENTEELLARLEDWYLGECNDDWEHSYGVRIETVDNPGWLVTIDLVETDWQRLSVERVVEERSDRDWIQYEVAEGKYVASGGPKNLRELIATFFRIVDTQEGL